ncbi:MAG: copper homeostasis protein CutC [Lutimonas sp.]
MKLELCTDCVEGALLAGRYGFKRIELCSALSEGGLTPSFGMIQSCAEVHTIEVHAMIRTRGGSFACDDSEMLVMQNDIKAASEAGAKGVVFGVLETSQKVSSNNQVLLDLAHSLGLQATFHRAFDQVDDPFKALAQLVEMGFDRLLTSGQQDRAIDGLELLRTIQEEYGSKIEIMAGSGVNPDNALSFAEAGLENIHFTSRKPSEEKIITGMGVNMITDETKIRAIHDLFA